MQGVRQGGWRVVGGRVASTLHQVNWATSPGGAPKQDTSQHHHIFVGDLSPEIDTETLR